MKKLFLFIFMLWIDRNSTSKEKFFFKIQKIQPLWLYFSIMYIVDLAPFYKKNFVKYEVSVYFASGYE